MRKYLILVGMLFSFGALYAQEDEKQLIQFTGRVLNDYLQPLPYAHILVLNDNNGAITDKDGRFSFVVRESDSIRFSTLAYKKATLTIPNDLEAPFYVRDVLLTSDTIMIAEIEVYPWKDYEEFKEAFVNLELPEDDMDRARKNIALIKTQLILENNPSARTNFKQVMQEQYNQTSYRGTYPTYQLFNVFAWSKFFKAIKNGDFKND